MDTCRPPAIPQTWHVDDNPSVDQIREVLWEEFDRGSGGRARDPEATRHADEERGYRENAELRRKQQGWWKANEAKTRQCAWRAGCLAANLAGPDRPISVAHMEAVCAKVEQERADKQNGKAKDGGGSVFMTGGIC